MPKQPTKGSALAGALGAAPKRPVAARPHIQPGRPASQLQQPGMVYAGGTPNFDERTGRPVQQPNRGGMVSIPENNMRPMPSTPSYGGQAPSYQIPQQPFQPMPQSPGIRFPSFGSGPVNPIPKAPGYPQPTNPFNPQLSGQQFALDQANAAAQFQAQGQQDQPGSAMADAQQIASGAAQGFGAGINPNMKRMY